MTDAFESNDSTAKRLRQLGERVQAGDPVARRELAAELHPHLERMRRRAQRKAAMNNGRSAVWPAPLPSPYAPDYRDSTAVSFGETVRDW